MLAELVELAPEGFEQVDGDGFVEFALYGAAGELPELADGPARVGGTLVHVSTSAVGDDWAERWREFHRPVQIGRVRVRAPWHEPADGGEGGGGGGEGGFGEGEGARGGGEGGRGGGEGGLSDGGIDVVIDPGQAFGTGAHPTTRLCLELLQEVTKGARGSGAAGNADDIRITCGTGPLAAPRGTGPLGPLADLGCGSGVLAIAAAKLGFGPVLAVDNEQAAVEATLANARANGVTLERVERYDLRSAPAPVEPVTVANLVRPLLLRVAELWDREGERAPERPEALIVSGLLEGEEEEVAAAFASLRERRRLRLQGWSALLLTPP